MYKINHSVLRAYALMVPKADGLFLEPVLGVGQFQRDFPSKGEAVIFPSFDKAREMARLLAVNCELWAVDVPSTAHNKATKIDGAYIAPQITPVQALLGFEPEKPWC